jgi:hypothetical protein
VAGEADCWRGFEAAGFDSELEIWCFSDCSVGLLDGVDIPWEFW